jgi:hypothetical protein
MTTDRLALKNAIHANIADIRGMKERRSESHQPRWKHGTDDDLLRALKGRATNLCTLAASLRRRVHIAGQTLEDQTKHLDASNIREEFEASSSEQVALAG